MAKVLITPSLADLQLSYPHRKPTEKVEINWQHPLTKGLVGFWLMTDDYKDLTGNNDGVQVGTVTNDIGIKGSCSFVLANNSTDRIDLGSIDSDNPLSCNKNNSFSIIAGLEVNSSNTSGSNYPRIFDKSSGANGSKGFILYHHHQENNFVLQIDKSNNISWSTNISGLDPYIVCAASYEPGNADLFLNGVFDRNVTNVTNNVSTVTTNAALLNWNHNSDRQYNLPVYFVAIYDTKLDKESIISLQLDPYQILQGVESTKLSIGKSIFDLLLPNDKIHLPELFYRNRKPSGRSIKVNPLHSLAPDAYYLLNEGSGNRIHNIGLDPLAPDFLIGQNSTFDWVGGGISSSQNLNVDPTTDNSIYSESKEWFNSLISGEYTIIIDAVLNHIDNGPIHLMSIGTLEDGIRIYFQLAPQTMGVTVYTNSGLHNLDLVTQHLDSEGRGRVLISVSVKENNVSLGHFGREEDVDTNTATFSTSLSNYSFLGYGLEVSSNQRRMWQGEINSVYIKKKALSKEMVEVLGTDIYGFLLKS